MFNPLNPASWFLVFIGGVAVAIGDAYAKLLVEIVKILLRSALPSADQLRNPWFLVGLGGTYGLARMIIGLIAIIVSLYAMLTPTRHHGRKLGQVFTTFLMVAVFAVAFYPAYGMVVTISKGLVQAMLNLAGGSENATSASIVQGIVSTALPSNPFGKAITALLAAIFGGLALVESFGLQIWLFVLLMFYPLVLATRPLNRATNALFNACNSGIVVIVLSLPAMAFGFLLPVVTKNYVPYGDTGIAAFATTILGGVFAMGAPPLLLVFFYQKSSEIFGRIDASVGGTIDIGQMPNVTTEQIQGSVDDTSGSGLKAFLSTVAVGGATAELGKSDDLFGDIKKLAIEGVAVAATVGGHPEVGAVLAAVDTTLTKEKRAHATNNPEGGA